MHRRSPLPPLILGLLTVLAAGAVVLGLVQAPPTPDLTVHNGAGELGYASSFAYVEHASTLPGYVIRIDYRAPNRVTETVTLHTPRGQQRRSRSFTGPSVRQEALGPFTKAQGLTGFTAQGPAFVATAPVTSLVPASERSEFSGTVRYSARISGGYLVGLGERYRYTVRGRRVSNSSRIQVTSINGQPAP